MQDSIQLPQGNVDDKLMRATCSPMDMQTFLPCKSHLISLKCLNAKTHTSSIFCLSHNLSLLIDERLITKAVFTSALLSLGKTKKVVGGGLLCRCEYKPSISVGYLSCRIVSLTRVQVMALLCSLLAKCLQYCKVISLLS